MLKYSLRRIGSGVVLLFAVSTVTYFLLIAGAGDIARKRLGVSATQEAVFNLNEQLGLHRPIFDQYLDWLRHAVTGDLGRSWFGPQSVVEALTSRLGVTLTLVVGATLVAAALAVVLGILGAVRGGGIDKTVQFIGLTGFAIPGFLIAFALINLLAVRLGWFPALGYVGPTESVTGWLKSITLPILSLAAAALASVTLQIRGSVRDALENDYVRTLRARGIPSRRVLYKHVLRNAAGPALHVLGVQFIGMLGATVIIEQLFVMPGLGEVAVNSTAEGDIPLVMGLVLVVAALVVIVNLGIDLITAWLNPKVRLS